MKVLKVVEMSESDEVDVNGGAMKCEDQWNTVLVLSGGRESEI